VVFISEFQPPSNLIKIIASTILDWMQEQGCSLLISPEGLVIDRDEEGEAGGEGDEKPKESSGLVDLFARARNIKVGPPPKPNRAEYPFVGTINFQGLMVHVENKAGDVREGTDGKGTKWRTHMKLPYGEIVGSLGTDGDKLDVYVGPYRNAPNVYIVHQNHARGPKKGKYDEDKVMIGFDSAEQAKAAYLAHYDSPRYFRSITTMAFPLFKRIVQRKEIHGEKVASRFYNTWEEASQAAAVECCPISDVRSSAEYRTEMVKVMTKQAISQALERAKSA